MYCADFIVTNSQSRLFCFGVIFWKCSTHRFLYCLSQEMTFLKNYFPLNVWISCFKYFPWVPMLLSPSSHYRWSILNLVGNTESKLSISVFWTSFYNTKKFGRICLKTTPWWYFACLTVANCLTWSPNIAIETNLKTQNSTFILFLSSFQFYIIWQKKSFAVCQLYLAHLRSSAFLDLKQDQSNTVCDIILFNLLIPSIRTTFDILNSISGRWLYLKFTSFFCDTNHMSISGE